MKLPLGLSVPHAGLRVPAALQPKYLLTPAETAADGDLGAAEIYALAGEVARFVRCDVARAVVDMNRAADDDARPDGVFKQLSIWGQPIWREPLTAAERAELLRAYHEPYHRTLDGYVGAVQLAVDCHTMSDVGPPIGPDAGQVRPIVCVGDAFGAACPRSWAEAMVECLRRYFGDDVAWNEPFAGGYVTRSHGRRMPWLQLEISRTDAVSIADKRDGVRAALRDWCRLGLSPEPYGTPVA